MFSFCTDKFQKSLHQNKPLADSSIYTYYSRIAEPWLTHSLQYLDSEDDFNISIAKIYQQIVTNTRLADDAGQPEFKKSVGETSRIFETLP